MFICQMVIMHIAGSAMGRLTIASRGRALVESGSSAREVARTLNVDPKTIRKLMHRHHTTGTVADRPPASPDLNPIEHLWDQLKQSLDARIGQENTLRDLPQLMVEAWEGIAQVRIRRLINSMHRRCRAAIDNRGGYTPY